MTTTSGPAPDEPELLLELRHVSAGYGRNGVLTDVNWQVRRGKVVGLLGPNGAGKTTLLRTVCGQTTISGGDIVIDGQPVTGLRTYDIVRQGIAHVVEGRGILAGLSVLDNLLIGAYSRGGDTKARLADVYQLFPRLRERSGQRAETLSGGEQQMLAIGRGLMMNPVLMLLDEPSQGLSPLMVETVLASIRAVQERGVTIVIVEQSPDLLAKLVNEVVLVAGGRTVGPLPPAVLTDTDVLTAVLAQGVLPESAGAAADTRSAQETVLGDQGRQPEMEHRGEEKSSDIAQTP
jgi:branched-chain amino acid transport system ATP-binding protein